MHYPLKHLDGGDGSADEAARLRPDLAARHPLSDRPLTVGGRAWTITAVPSPDPLMARIQTDADLDTFPYGLLLWPAALALAERLAAAPSLVAGKRVLELGAGAGLPGLVAQSLGAAVTQTDYQDDALRLGRLNALQNGVTGMEAHLADWRCFPPLRPFPVVLGSDILYERSLHPALLSLLPRMLAPGGLLLLSDPIRPPALEFADSLERSGWKLDLESHTVLWDSAPKECALLVVRR